MPEQVEERLEEDDILAYAGQFDGTVCGDDRYTPRVIDACLPRLKVISKWGTGIDSIDKEYANHNGVVVGNTPNAFTTPVSDTVMGYMLAFARRQPWMDRAMKAGTWQKLPSRALSECTLGVIGVGNIGKAVTRRARAFGMTVLGNDIVEIDHVFITESGIQMTGLEELLRRADFVQHQLHAQPQQPAPDQQRYAGADETRCRADQHRPRPDRGRKSADYGAAERAYWWGGPGRVRVRAAAQDSPLLGMDNVMLAPHNSNSSPTAWERVHWNTVRNLLSGLGIPQDDLDPEDYPA